MINPLKEMKDSSCEFHKFRLPFLNFGPQLLLNSFLFAISANAGFVVAQQLPQLSSPVTPAKGTSVNLSVQGGNKSSLTFGTNSNFGVNVSAQSTAGMNQVSSSSFYPSEAKISSEIGSGTTAGKITAEISNLKASGNGPTNIGGEPINSTNSDFASGKAVLDGLKSTVNIVLKPTDSYMNTVSSPNIVGGVACTPSFVNPCSFSDALGKKPYAVDKDNNQVQQFANGSANSSVGTNTTVEIGSNTYQSSFAQAF